MKAMQAGPGNLNVSLSQGLNQKSEQPLSDQAISEDLPLSPDQFGTYYRYEARIAQEDPIDV
jgi:hypothetical protein